MASTIIGSLAGHSSGFRTTFTVTFEKIAPPLIAAPGSFPAARLLVPLPTIVPISRSFFEADITIEMPQAGSGNRFTLSIYGLANDIYKLLDPQNTLVHISLGYADGGSPSEVIAGILTEANLTPAADNCFYQGVLKGVDYVYDQLQYPAQNLQNFKSTQGQNIGQIATSVCNLIHVASQITTSDPAIDPLTRDDVSPLTFLQELARRGGYALQVRDGKVRMGAPSALGTVHPVAIQDGTTSKPVTARGAKPASSSSTGQEFDMAGDPTIRPNDTVTFGTDQFLIESVTHKYTRDGGYRCVGRALSTTNLADQKMAGKPTAARVAKSIQDNINTREQTRPAVSAGEVGDYTAGKHTTSVNIGAAPTPDMANPTVQAPLRSDPGTLPDKPIASPFAFGSCGLVVPVYKKMRALMVHGWNDPNDAVVDGFLWTSNMTPPPNQAGDWWLSLPTELDGDGLPTGATVDDLIAANGQRVISVKGMQIAIGSGLLNQAGSRPSPGSDESLTITTDQGAKLTVKGAQIEMTDGSVTLTVSNGKVSIS